MMVLMDCMWRTELGYGNVFSSGGEQRRKLGRGGVELTLMSEVRGAEQPGLFGMTSSGSSGLCISQGASDPIFVSL